MRKYEFDWRFIGNIEDGRTNLGPCMDLDVYRLMQFTMRDILEERFGVETTDEMFYAAGKKAGREFYNHFIAPVSGLSEFVSKTQRVLREKRIGILRIEEEAIAQDGKLVLTIDEDLDCSGLPVEGYETCTYDEGFVAALLEAFTNESWKAKEVDCWTTGARTCRFLVTKEV